jgi:hypothetical protein
MKLWDKLFGWTLDAELAGLQEYEAVSGRSKRARASGGAGEGASGGAGEGAGEGAAAAKAALRPEERVEALEKSVGRLALISRALVATLERQGLVDAEVLQQVMDEIDAEDGVVDGMVTPEHLRP